MKKSLVALAVFGAFSGLAQADNSSVTLYGIVDAGIMTQSKAGAAASAYTTAPAGTLPGTISAGSATGFVDGQILPSIYGIKGTEDLGGGLNAGFTLEGGLSTANGTHNSPGIVQSQIFGREAKVTIGGGWGTVGAGLQVDPAFVAAIGTEARGMTDSLSSLENWIIGSFLNGSTSATTGSGPGVSLQGGIFDANSLSYTYSGNGLYLGLLYGFGGIAGSSSANSQYSIGASYKISGFTVAAGYVADKAATVAPLYTGNSSVIDHIGVGYEWAPFAVRLQYAQFKYNNSLAVSNGDNVKDIGLGIDWTIGANKLNLAYYNSKDSGAASASVVGYEIGGKTTEFALMDTYSLSKRTSVYAQLASVKADSNAGDSAALGGIYDTTAGGLAAVAGASTVFFGLGIQHTF
jgi:predicted porin